VLFTLPIMGDAPIMGGGAPTAGDAFIAW